MNIKVTVETEGGKIKFSELVADELFFVVSRDDPERGWICKMELLDGKRIAKPLDFVKKSDWWPAASPAGVAVWFVESRINGKFDGWFSAPEIGTGGWLTDNPNEAKSFTQAEAKAVAYALTYFRAPFAYSKWEATEHIFVAAASPAGEPGAPTPALLEKADFLEIIQRWAPTAAGKIGLQTCSQIVGAINEKLLATASPAGEGSQK